jgi:hypothetical protein
MFSQYWFCALTVAFEHGPPGCAAADGTAPMSATPATKASQSSAPRVLINMASGAC